jgi:DNA polymerase-3 subunit chi
VTTPRVEFHSGLAEPLLYACRLLRKACRQGARVAVTAPVSTLQALDRELWTFETDAFVPHRRVPSHRAASVAEDALRRTPIWLCEGEVPADGPPVLVNLGAAAPAEPARFERIVELVALEPDERRAARSRWREYEASGMNIEHHERGASR